MDKEEYKNNLKENYKFWRKSLVKNGKIALAGLGLALLLSIYNTKKSAYELRKVNQIPIMKEIYENRNNKEKANELRETAEFRQYAPKVEKTLQQMKNLRKITFGLITLSELYFIGGWTIPTVNYFRKKKNLEKELVQTNL